MFYEGMIGDKFFKSIDAENEEEAEKIIIDRLRTMVNTLTDEELASELGVIVW